MAARQVSLNIHDPLTFEGTEICLHPDLGKFAVGDLVEIRVWDTSIVVTESVQPNNTSNSPSAASSHSSNNTEPLNPLHYGKSIETTTTTSEGNDAREGEMSSTVSLASGGDIGTSSTPLSTPHCSPLVLPTKTVTLTTGEGLPPVPPNKPKPVHQQQQQQQRRSRKASRHVRDVSDVTVDSWAVEAANGGDTHTHQQQQQQQDAEISSQHPLRLSFTILVSENSLNSLKGSARTQVSILRQVADLYRLSSYDIVSVHTVHDKDELLESSKADFVLVTFKDQFISRGEMHLFQENLVGTWVYEGKRLQERNRNFQATAREIRHSDQRTASGLITEKTTIAFRSRSARIIWLVQLSAEMWDYASPYERRSGGGTETESVCELYFDRWITFVHKLFDKWKEMEVTHSLTVVFFSRSFLRSQQSLTNGPRDVYGRLYEDHYRVVIENETCLHWHSLIVRLKEAFVSYPSEVGWTVDDTRQPSIASRGNVLEAINVTLNLLQFHFLDRDLHRTGNSIVVVSAGNGVFEVDKGLARITYQRMLDNGIGSDMLSLGLPALHIAPFFIYTIIDQSDEADDEEAIAQDYEVPHWMHLSFVSYQSDFWVFVDHLIEKQDVTVDRSVTNNAEELRVAPHGFLLSRRRRADSTGAVANSTSPLLHPTAGPRFNPSSSPTTTNVEGVYNTRKLIEGRNLRDILDACRPRDFGKLPSALCALLKLHANKTEEPSEPEKKEAGSGDVQEWGALDSDVNTARFSRRALSLGSEVDAPLSPTLGLLSSTPPRRGPIRFSDNASSHSSSCASRASHPSPTFLGTGGNPTTLQLQRSLSFETTGTTDASAVSSDDDESTTRLAEVEERIRKMMTQHDKVVSSATSAITDNFSQGQFGEPDHVSQKQNAASVLVRKQGTDSYELSGRREPSNPPAESSGLDAALKHYRTYGPHQQPGNHEGRIQLLTRNGSIGRINHPTSTPSSFQRFSQFAGTGLSPLILPPVITTNDAPETISGEAKQPIFNFDRSRSTLTEQASASPETSQGSRINRPREGLFGRASLQSPGRNRFVALGTSPRKDDATMGRLLGTSPPERRTRSGMTSEPTSLALSLSPPDRGSPIDPPRLRSRQQRTRSVQAPKHPRRKKALNPFRQQDEDEVLKTKSFNRRRWSHVFPRGEVEFKRHAGPNWKSLTGPAILPLGVDYFPSRYALLSNYTHNMHTLTLSEFPRNNYTSHRDLLSEMVRQRLSQDFQLVDPSIVDPNFFKYRREVINRNAGSNVVRFFLSMGHRLQVLTYDPLADLVEVESYTSKQAQKHVSLLRYQYHSFCQETQTYRKVTQSFSKYASLYLWNLVDRIVCGNPNREMRDGMRSRRIMFGIMPDDFDGNQEAESEYLKKFQRLFEYFEKIRDKEADSPSLKVKIVSSENRKPQSEGERTESKPGVEGDAMTRFSVQLRKGKRDIWEWMEVAADSTLDTNWSYRIIFSWLVGSSGRIDAQVQSLKRRCAQFGLRLIPFPHISTSRNLFIQPFKAPVIVTVRDIAKAEKLDQDLSRIGFIHDGVFKTDHNCVLDCIERRDMFKFLSGRLPARFVNGRQFVHRTGTLFVRILTDTNGLAIVIILGNYRFMMSSKDSKVQQQYTDAYGELDRCLTSL